MANCHCLCRLAHPWQRGICNGEGMVTVRADSRLTGQRAIPMCAMCADATLKRAQAQQEDTP